LDADARAKRETSPLRVFDVKNPSVREALQAAPKIGESLCDECSEHFARVREGLDAYGVRYTLEPTLVRGLDYYTRTTFEFKDEAIGAQDSICGGGRYDGLIEAIGGPPTPGIGFGAGIERLLISMEEAGLEAEQPTIDMFFAFESAADRARVLPLVADLRRRGLSVDADYAGRSLKGQLTQAQRLGAAKIVIVEGDESIVRAQGAEDERVPTDKLLATLTA